MKEYDLIIIGGGPGGYSAAIAAGHAGLKTAVVEQEAVGGTCVNWGCIPTKALLKYAKLRREGSGVTYEEAAAKSFQISRERRDAIVAELGRLGVEIIFDRGVIAASGQVWLQTAGETISAGSIIISTGSTARRLPIAEYDDTHIVTSREALDFAKVPESVVVVGSGATGIELASVWSAFGAQVTVLEMAHYIMGTGDEELSRKAECFFAGLGMTVKTNASVEKVARSGDRVEVTYRDGEGTHVLQAEKALIAAGIVPTSAGLGLEELGVELSRGFVQVDEKMSTNIPGIYAVGDVTGKLALAFTATLQGKLAVAAITGSEFTPIAYENIPRCIFSAIEASSVGLSGAQALAQGYEVEVTTAPMISHDGHLVGKEKSVIKVVADKATQRILGASIVGPDAADRIAGPTRMVLQGATAAETINAVCSGR